MKVSCPVCEGASQPWGETLIRGKYKGVYRRCARCGLVWVPDPYWLEEAYADPINRTDIGLV